MIYLVFIVKQLADDLPIKKIREAKMRYYKLMDNEIFVRINASRWEFEKTTNNFVCVGQTWWHARLRGPNGVLRTEPGLAVVKAGTPPAVLPPHLWELMPRLSHFPSFH